MAPILRVAILAAVVSLCASAAAGATYQETYVTRVIDGDTFVVADQSRVRVRNFDTPELRRYACPAERALAMRARDAATGLLVGRRVTLRITDEDRYDRLVADVAIHRGVERVDFASRMVALGVGAHWAYGREPQPEWCPHQSGPAGRDRDDAPRTPWRSVWEWLGG